VDNSIAETESEWIPSGKLGYTDIVKEIYDRANRTYGTNLQPPGM
jgi:hypothetical protein